MKEITEHELVFGHKFEYHEILINVATCAKCNHFEKPDEKDILLAILLRLT